MKTNLKEIVSKEYEKIYDGGSSMHKYCMSKFSNAVILGNGMIYVFEKPTIEKDFCFGFYIINMKGHMNIMKCILASLV